MSSTKLSVNDFKNRLKSEVDQIATNNGWNFNNPTHRGYAFQIWVAQMFCNENKGFDTAPEDATIYGASDLKADILLEDTNQKHLLIAQCKFQGISKPRQHPIDETEVNDFFNRHDLYLKREWVESHGNILVVEQLKDYKEKIKDGYSVDYYFVSTGIASQRTVDLVNECNHKYSERKALVKCHLLDFENLKDFYVRSLSLEESCPTETVQITLQKDHLFELADDLYPTIITVIKGNVLRDLYKKHKESLFARNIRSFLGRRTGINNEIKQTAENQPSDFFYLNNGVSAICTDYTINDNCLLINNFQIINGAQTVGSLAWAEPNSEIQVLFRLSKTDNTKTSDLREQIIYCNNTQNAIKDSDFRSNDEIQVWLERQFKSLKLYESLPKIYYTRKRTYKKGTGRIVKLEDLAKIRYAFLHEPTLIHDSPGNLWTRRTEGGVYEKAFGLFNAESETWEISELWSEEEFLKCLVALTFYFKIDETYKNRTKQDPTYAYLQRLRYHALAMAGIYYTKIAANPPEAKKVLENKDVFDSLWKKVWSEARRILIDTYNTSVKQGKQSLYGISRSKERWSEMMDRFTQNIKMQDLDDF